MTGTDRTNPALVRLLRDEGRGVLATLVRFTGDLQRAEDAVQDAVERALRSWPRTGVPEQPAAWLRTTARRCAIDAARRESARRGKEVRAMDPRLSGSSDGGLPLLVDVSDSTVRDDLLRLIFTCCHPALSTEAQVALTLRTLCGLTTAEVARALLVSEETMRRRLSRAKQKVTQASIAYRVPADHELPARWGAVLATVYLVFNEGYAATSGPQVVRDELADEGVRLARLLVSLGPDDPSALGLLALVLLQDSRRSARADEHGRLVLLADQDRSRWDRQAIREGVDLVAAGLRRTPQRPDRYVVQAAIAACHALAATYAETDWSAVVSWYDVLVGLDNNPVVALNRAVAVGERDGPGAGLRAVDAIANLEAYPWWHASRAVLLRRLGRDADAGAATAAALALDLNDVQRAHLEWRARE